MDAAELMAAWPRCERALRRQAYTYWSQPAEVDDAVQEMFVRVYPKRGVIESVRHLRAYLRVTLRYYRLNWYREQAEYAAYVADQARNPEPHVAPDAYRRVLLRDVRNAMEKLPPADQAHLRLYWSRETLTELSRIADVPLTTLSARRRAALRRLRRRLR